MTTGARIGRPPKTSRDQILDAAALFDARTLQLTSIAEELGISVKTVYYYFPNRKALLDALTERAVLEHEAPEFDEALGWDGVLRTLAHWVYRLAYEYPDWYLNLAGTRGLGLRLFDDVLNRLVDAGFDEHTALHTFDAVTGYAAYAGQAASRVAVQGGIGEENVRRHLVEYAPAEVSERVVRLFAGADLANWFAQSLEIIIAGVAAQQPPTPSA